MANWGDLPGGVVALLAKRLQLIEDFIAFRSTCSSWRKATSLTDFDKSCPRLPLLLLHKSDEKRWDYIYETPDEVDEVDENVQIHSDDDEDYSSEDTSNDEDYSAEEDTSDDEEYSDDESDEVNCENDKGGENDDIHESEAIKENYESDEEKSEIDENHEIEEENSDTDENTQIHSSDDENTSDYEDSGDDEDYSDDESDEDVANEVDCKNDKVDENDDIHKSEEIQENYESDENLEIEEIKENTEIVADEMNYEHGKGDENDDVHQSEEIKEKYESDEEKSEKYENHEIEEENSDTDENYYDSDEIKENKEIVVYKVNYKNGTGDENDDIDESNGSEENLETDDNSENGEEKSVGSDYENDKMQEGNSDTSDTSGTDDYYDSDENFDSQEQRLFSLSKEKGCMISLPEAIGMECRGSKGWLIMVERSTGNMCLFHPLTRARITLPKAPPEVMFPILPKHIRSAVLSASPSETSDYVVMVSYAEPNYTSGSYVVFWKPVKPTWTRVETPAPCVEDLKYYNGKFYALTWRSDVWMCDISGPNPNIKAIKIIELPWKWSRPHAQLVECGGRLLVVAPLFRYHYNLEACHDLKMVELDVINGSYSTITSLGSSTVFLGRNEGFSVDANQFPPGIIEPNRIYFSDRSYRIASRGRDNVPRPDLGLGCRGVWINF